MDTSDMVIYKTTVLDDKEFLIGYFDKPSDTIEGIKNFCKAIFGEEPKLERFCNGVYVAKNIKHKEFGGNIRFAVYPNYMGNIFINDYTKEIMNSAYELDKPNTYNG